MLIWDMPLLVRQFLADRQGFEPWRRSPAYTLSRRAPSTTRPPVRWAWSMRLALGFQEPKIYFRAHDSKNLILGSCAHASSFPIKAGTLGEAS